PRLELRYPLAHLKPPAQQAGDTPSNRSDSEPRLIVGLPTRVQVGPPIRRVAGIGHIREDALRLPADRERAPDSHAAKDMSASWTSAGVGSILYAWLVSARAPTTAAARAPRAGAASILFPFSAPSACAAR